MLQLAAKWAIGDFFSLRMLLKRFKNFSKER